MMLTLLEGRHHHCSHCHSTFTAQSCSHGSSFTTCLSLLSLLHSCHSTFIVQLCSCCTSFTTLSTAALWLLLFCHAVMLLCSSFTALLSLLSLPHSHHSSFAMQPCSHCSSFAAVLSCCHALVAAMLSLLLCSRHRHALITALLLCSHHSSFTVQLHSCHSSFAALFYYLSAFQIPLANPNDLHIG